MKLQARERPSQHADRLAHEPVIHVLQHRGIDGENRVRIPVLQQPGADVELVAQAEDGVVQLASQQRPPSGALSLIPPMSCGCGASGAFTVRLAVRARLISTLTKSYRYDGSSTLRCKGVKVTLPAVADRWMRQVQGPGLTASRNCAGLTTSSTNLHSLARWPRTPSFRVQKISARSCRTLRLSVTRA
jgi:hypothetical protein